MGYLDDLTNCDNNKIIVVLSFIYETCFDSTSFIFKLFLNKGASGTVAQGAKNINTSLYIIYVMRFEYFREICFDFFQENCFTGFRDRNDKSAKSMDTKKDIFLSCFALFHNFS